MKAEKPFTPDQNKKMEAMVDAANHVYAALKALDEAAQCSDHWGEFATLNSFKRQLADFMSSDNGEAGFDPYMVKTSERVFAGKKNPIKDARQMAMRYRAFTRAGRQVGVSIPD